MNISIRNAAGMARTQQDVQRLCNSAVTDIVVGTYTWSPRHGNSGQTTGFNQKTRAYANAMNMPNVGFEVFLTLLPTFVEMAHRNGKRLIVSIAGETPEQYGIMAYACYRLGADGVEYNFGCPNSFEVNGVQNPIPSHEPDLARDILQRSRPLLHNIDRTVGIKISPVGLRLLHELSDVFLQSLIVGEISACNTVGGQVLALEDGSFALAYRVMGKGEVRHDGGLSGEPLKQRSLHIVETLTGWRLGIPVIALGGIFSGDDALSYLEKKAAGFGCGAAHMVYGEKVYGDIAAELAEHF